jgi:hypothetical protein
MSTEVMKLQEIMTQAQVFASAWSLVGGRFDGGNAMDEAEVAKNELYQMVAEALAQPQQEPVAWMTQARNFVHPMEFTEEEAKSYGWKAVYTSPPAQLEPVEYWTVANGWVSDQAEVPAAVWVEPDFWEHCNRVNCATAYRLPAPGRQPLYTSPPAQEFVCSTGLCHYRKPLTDEEIETVWMSVQANDFHDCVKPFVRAIEAAHGIKENK